MVLIKISTGDNRSAVEKAVAVLQAGGTVVFPTETCYGIGADATSQAAVDRLYQYKSRREGKPLSVVVSDKRMAARFVEINEVAESLYDNYLPGPITVVSRGLGQVAKGVESEYGTLGIRIPDHKLVLDIARAFGRPFTATSANVSYKPKPYSIESLLSHTPVKSKKLIDLVLDGGELAHREASTVVDTTTNNLNIMRRGQSALLHHLADQRAGLRAETTSSEETVAFGALNMLKYIDEPAKGPLVFLLSGELGTGKTHFAKGVARQLGIQGIVRSPSFTLLNEYRYVLGHRKGLFVHLDTWRMESSKDLDAIGLDNYLKNGNVIVIEWADKFYDTLATKVKSRSGKPVNVMLQYVDEQRRRLETYE